MRRIVAMLVGPCVAAAFYCATALGQEVVRAPSQAAAESTEKPHWAFLPLSRPALPGVKDAASARTPVDRFILARLEEKGLALSPQADRYTLCRRLYFDLTGLPPSPEEIAAFVSDSAPGAYERLVDRLLASPRFGERWARHWLDAAGYVDVMGGDNDAATVKLAANKWLYRDWVVRALNEDKPWRDFLTEQIAGDELYDWREAATLTGEMKDSLVATGFLRTAGDDTDENELNTLDIRYGVLQRTAEVLSGNLLGLTMQCAKCHDHKYEPISQRDYYRLLSLLKPALDPDHWLQPKDRALADVSPPTKAKIDAENAELEREGDRLQRQIGEISERYEQKLFDVKLAAIPEPIREDTKTALRTEKEIRSEVQKYLVEKFEAQTRVKPEEVAAALSADDKAAIEALERQIAEIRSRRRGYERIQAVYDVGPPTPTRILQRGEPTKPGGEVQPGLISVLSPPSEGGVRGGPSGQTSGRRLALARWLTDDTSPAAAIVLRVRVNRVWQRLFGRGIVATSDNFGVTGTPPTHPELLEWLACQYAESGGRLKPLVQMIVTSSVYREASAVSMDGSNGSSITSSAATVDPDNDLVWRQRLRRLESEAVRDAMLAAGGKLVSTMGGPPVMTNSRPDGYVAVVDEGPAGKSGPWQRSLYLLQRRNYHPTLLAVFDQPALATNCTCRTSSAVVLQSLAMLNDEFVADRAAEIARRAATQETLERQVERAFLLVLGRPPRASEAAECIALVERHSLEALCHVLLNTSEFLYIP